MKKEIKKFLEFNGKNIFFQAVDGIQWIAIKPICEALEIDDQKQYENLNEMQSKVYALYAERRLEGKDNLTKIISEQLIIAKNNQFRKMLCISEQFVYGWIFQIQSPKNTNLLLYKLQCYQILFNHFHGTIGKRQDILKVKTQTQIKIEQLENDLKNTKEYLELQELTKKNKAFSWELKKLDNSYVEEQLEIWKQDLQTEKQNIYSD